MCNEVKEDDGIQLLIEKYREMFRIPENLNHYSKTDLKIAERKFLKYALNERIG
jgi:hypothetical protein